MITEDYKKYACLSVEAVENSKSIEELELMYLQAFDYFNSEYFKFYDHSGFGRGCKRDLFRFRVDVSKRFIT
ncbi:hypothetical protein [Wohlfahrtiimonas larvae]|uniref:Uncharacterized protein n=1 Tax=Wohlfahrtiimonas larvae TaxID=1157986 RepID=A0ABP9MLP4_9GAMM|nr:hypothetical protein [Wohlfahrtiimonas larvae]